MFRKLATLVFIVLGHGDLSAQQIADLREIVRGNFAAIETLNVAVDIVQFPVDRALEPVAIRRTWASKAPDKVRYSYTTNYRFGDQVPHPKIIGAYDGLVARSIVFDPQIAGKQARGYVDYGTGNWTESRHTVIQLTECLRAWGWEIDNYSLPEWLESPSIWIRPDRVGGLDGVTVEVWGFPENPGEPGHGVRSDFFFAKRYNFALAQYAGYIDNEHSLTVRSSEFKEIADGVWFPLTGTVTIGEKRRAAFPGLSNYEFHVASVEANQEFPERYFVLEFSPDLSVHTVDSTSAGAAP